MMGWTPEQLRAIEADGTNVIVSAGAGSGKTAVLTERIFEKIKQGANLDELLVLTFTNAAAHEMKERTKKKLSSCPETRHLVSEVDASYITTFDSYAYSLVRKYHYMLNLPRDISIIDETLILSRKYAYLQEIFQELYDKEDPDFYDLIREYALKDDQEIKDFIIRIDAISDLQLDKEKYFAQYFDCYFNEKRNKEDFFEIYEHQKRILAIAFLELDKLSHELDRQACQEVIKTLLNAKTYQEFMTLLSGFRFPNAPRSKDIPDEDKIRRKEIKAVCLKTLGLTFPYDEKNAVSFYHDTKSYVKTILSLVKEMNTRLNKFKWDNAVFTFSDNAKMALSLLDNEDIRQEIANKIKYIMIDEYQDTSDIQEAFIQKIARNNLYMVGDVKQSIYRFRNANSEIFTKKYEQYSQNVDGEKIDLNTNFRSREEVIININKIFTSLMNEKQGGANYARDHLILPGKKEYNDCLNGHSYHQEIYLYSAEDVKVSSLNKNEYEASLIAEDIIKKINDGYQVFDKDKEVLRQATFADFAILLETKSHFETYKAIFDKYHIPLKAEKDLEIASSQVIMVFKNLLVLIDGLIKKEEGPAFRHAFMSVARSFLFEFDDQKLYEIMKQGNFANTLVCQTLAPIVEEASSLSLPGLIEKILLAVDFDYKLIKVGNVLANKHQVEYLYQSAGVFAKLGYTLEQFLEYFASVEEYKIDLNVPNVVNQESTVVLMSIHKSKGLEFPIVYYAGMGRKFNQSERRARFLMTSEYGIIIPFKQKEGETVNFYRTLFDLKENCQELSEKVRLLYVALTRAREKIIIIDQEKNRLVINDFSTISSLSDLLAISPYLHDFKHGKKVNDDCKIITSTKPSLNKKPFALHQLNITPILKETKRASKNIDFTVDENILEFGRRIHYLLELVDFTSIDTSFINDPQDRQIVDQFLNLDFFKQFKNPQYLKEYTFIINGQKGIIDLLIIEEKKITIVDYKMKKIDDVDYEEQLHIYREAITTLFPHHLISCYLVSVLTREIKEIK